jgi:cation:H+ antiporter
MPELVVSMIAGVRGEIDIAMGNVVASNTTNVTLVLGVAAVLSPLAARTELIRREGILMVGAVIALAAALAGGTVERWYGVVFLPLLVVAVILLVRWSARPGSVIAAVEGTDDHHLHGGWLVREAAMAGLALLATVGAAQLLLEGLLGIGGRLGWSAVFLGLLTGVGTSLPEAAAAVAAARRGEGELVLGNVLGSNVFNSLGVAGVAAVVGPGELVALGWPLLVAMIGVAIVAGWFALTGERIVRWEGLGLLLTFVTYAVLTY